MPLSRSRRYRFQPPANNRLETFTNFSGLLNTRESDLAVGDTYLTKADNIRGTDNGGFETRKGSQQKGNQIGTTTKILGLHSYVDNDRSVKQLLATHDTAVYRFSETGTPATIATSTNSQATGYSKDRHVFVTTAHLDANSRPYIVVLYQSGSGIKLEWEDHPYGTWNNTVINVDASTQIAFSGYMDSNDNIHVAFNSDANTVKYVKLTYGSGPTWSVGTASTIDGSGASASAFAPSINYKVTSGITEHVVAARYYNGSTYVIRVYTSSDGTSWLLRQSLSNGDTSDSRHFPVVLNYSSGVYIVSQNKLANGSTDYGYNIYTGGSFSSYVSSVENWTNGTDGMFSAIKTGSSIRISAENSTSAKGSGWSVYGTSTTATNNSTRAEFTIVNDGSNDNDIVKTTTINDNTETSERVTNDSSNNIYPSVADYLPTNLTFFPVVFVEGTASPYNIKINSFSQWVSSLTGFTTGLAMNSAYFPNTGAGGTNQIYFVNGTDLPKKWDGTTATTATASGYPTPSWIVHFENRLWMGGDDNRVYYTNNGSDNFTGTFPSGNNIDFPEQILWGHRYSERVLLLFGRNTVYRIENFDYTGANVGPEKIRSIPNSYGTLAGRTVVQVGFWTYYQRPDGHVMRTNGQYAELVSEIITGTIEDLAGSQLANAAAGTLGDYYYLAVAESGAAQNNLWLVLDTTKAPSGGWSVDRGKNTSCFVQHPDSNDVPQIFWGDARSATGNVYQGEVGTNDDNTAITIDARTGLKFYGDLFKRKQVRDAIVVAEASGDWDMTLGVATGEYADSFTDYAIDLNPQSQTWGAGTWGTGAWGGKANSEQVKAINKQARSFRYRFYHDGLNEPVNVLGLATTFDILKDVV